VVWPQNHSDGFHRFGLKTGGDSFYQFDLKTYCDGFLQFVLKTGGDGLTSKLVVGFLVEPQNQGGGGFPGLGLKTDSSGLVIWASKSQRWFLSLAVKTKWASVCRLRHKTDGGRSARDTCRDLAACFMWKQA
jgi:hypothetical protein